MEHDKVIERVMTLMPQAQATQNQFSNIQSFNDIKVQMAADKCQTLSAISESTRTIVDELNSDRMAELTAENAALKLGISQAAQTATIVDQVLAGCKKSTVNA